MYSTLNGTHMTPNSFYPGPNQTFFNSTGINNHTAQQSLLPPQNVTQAQHKEIFLNRMENVTFHPDKLEMTVDVSGFRPEDVKCALKYSTVEIYAEAIEIHQHNHIKLILHIHHYLPQNVIPHLSACCLTTNGHLILHAPWHIQ